ncbi:MAG TPA: carboxymuconolactone decarboxylase family protein [Gammaproteobacteria bacterium]|nr:carboxymuconolactone decarboxylase family protein [Gammaproteobacteria bacterium]
MYNAGVYITIADYLKACNSLIPLRSCMILWSSWVPTGASRKKWYRPLDFELAALAISALNGCGMCMDAHTEKLKKDQVTPPQIQSAIRIAAVLHALCVGMTM